MTSLKTQVSGALQSKPLGHLYLVANWSTDLTIHFKIKALMHTELRQLKDRNNIIVMRLKIVHVLF